MAGTQRGNTMNNELTPNDFIIHPWNSVIKKNEAETVALNIMVILTRTGNAFRLLTWDEYRTERLKDHGFSHSEKAHFDKVVDYCASVDTAKLFAPAWRKVANNDE